MINVIKKSLEIIINNIDSGNSNITEDEGLAIINLINDIASPFVSKYQACKILNMSRAKFDNLVREGKLPRGKKRVGFTELFWFKSELDKAIEKLKK